MRAGPFVWKQGYFAPTSRVELSGGAIIIGTNNHQQKIDLVEIERVYVLRSYAVPVSHMIEIVMLLKSGQSARFFLSRYGIPGSAAEECKNAARALITHLQAANPAAEIYRGIRPTLKIKLSVSAIAFLAYLYVGISVLQQSDPAEWRSTGAVLIGLLVTMAGALFFSMRDSAIARKIGFEDAIEYLG
ncbi:MAG: hypothetical protein A3E78_16390 [Alphaproteobacteria bacterium RIFCSPHIGHO2_12_FULL_63_12]|nr:MAG: hypothetical protein A3E78_16390 [Alphaproteobacteria bacterium RIFCSPHIGHO2_12_FULL_63_12]